MDKVVSTILFVLPTILIVLPIACLALIAGSAIGKLVDLIITDIQKILTTNTQTVEQFNFVHLGMLSALLMSVRLALRQKYPMSVLAALFGGAAPAVGLYLPVLIRQIVDRICPPSTGKETIYTCLKELWRWHLINGPIFLIGFLSAFISPRRLYGQPELPPLARGIINGQAYLLVSWLGSRPHKLRNRLLGKLSPRGMNYRLDSLAPASLRLLWSKYMAGIELKYQQGKCSIRSRHRNQN